MHRERPKTPHLEGLEIDAIQLYRESAKTFRQVDEDLDVGANAFREWTGHLEAEAGVRPGVK